VLERFGVSYTMIARVISQWRVGLAEQYQLSTVDVLVPDRLATILHQLAAKKRTGFSGLGLEIGTFAIAMANVESPVHLFFYRLGGGFLAGLCHGQH